MSLQSVYPYRVMEGDVVANIVVSDPAHAEEMGWAIIPEGQPCEIGWTVVDGVPQFPPEPELDAAALKAALAALRWDKSQSGATWNGWDIPTDAESRNAYQGALWAIEKDLRADPSPWKLPRGYESLTNAQVTAMATAAYDYVQACFTAEAAVQAQVEAGTITRASALADAFDAALQEALNG